MMDNKPTANKWKTKSYSMGILGGVIVGVLASYLFTRAAEDEANLNGQPRRIETGQLLSLGLATLALVRQITELGKSPKK